MACSSSTYRMFAISARDAKSSPDATLKAFRGGPILQVEDLDSRTGAHAFRRLRQRRTSGRPGRTGRGGTSHEQGAAGLSPSAYRVRILRAAGGHRRARAGHVVRGDVTRM